MRHILELLLIAVAATALHAPAVAGSESLSVLAASGTVQARVMQIGMSEHAQRIFEKMQAATASRPDWARNFFADAPRGQAIPYHPNLGITEEEYKSFLAEPPTLQELGTISLSTERQPNGSIRLATEPRTQLNGVVISANEKSVTTPYGKLDEITQINNQDAQSASGRWTGTQWRSTTADQNSRLIVKLAIGKRLDHGDSIIYYDISDTRSGGLAYHEILLFPASK